MIGAPSDDVVIELADDLRSARISIAGRPWVRVAIRNGGQWGPRLELVPLDLDTPKDPKR